MTPVVSTCWNVGIQASLSHRELAVLVTMQGPGALPPIALDPAAREVSLRTGAGLRIPLRRRGGTLAAAASTAAAGPVHLRYRFPVAVRMLVPAAGSVFARPEAAHDLTSIRAEASGGAGLVRLAGVDEDAPSMVLWPDHDPPKLHLTIRDGQVSSTGGRVAREVRAAVAHLTELIGRLPDTTIVALTEPGRYACSRPGLITVDDRLLQREGTLTTQFLPHELTHQWFGNRVRFVGPGFLWGQECLPEAIQHRYLRARLGAAVADRMGRRYMPADRAVRSVRLLSLSPGATGALSLDEYHELLAAGTGLWLELADLVGAPAFSAVLRKLAASPTELTVEAVLGVLRGECGPRVDEALRRAVAGGSPCP